MSRPPQRAGSINPQTVAFLRAEPCTECRDVCIPRLDGLCPACGQDLQERRERARAASYANWQRWWMDQADKEDGTNECHSENEDGLASH